MLSNISIKNYALIAELDLELENGFSTITGETGAGKSIILGALGLLIGQRADTQSLLDPTKKCVIEGTFKGNLNEVRRFLAANELDDNDEIIIRREITQNGGSRAFINDTPVNLSQLKELGALLIDIHSQHQTRLLTDSGFQLGLLDSFAEHHDLIKNYAAKFSKYKESIAALEELKTNDTKHKAELDYIQFQFDELQSIRLDEINQTKLEEELSTLNNAENIKAALYAASGTLNNGDLTIVSMLTQIKTQLTSVSKYNSKVEEIQNRISATLIEIKDINAELDDCNEAIEFNPTRATEIGDTLDNLYRLQKKHQCNTVEDLIAIKNNFEGQLFKIQNSEELIQKLEKTISELKKELTSNASEISKGRKKSALSIEKEIASLLTLLSMPNAELELKLSPTELNSKGADNIEFLFSANKGLPKRSIEKVASGGELSRVMLCLKSIAARAKAISTLILDEIDTGVSGDVADKMGVIMKSMAKHMQVLTITHLPQIASKGSAHYFVHKEVKGDKTYSQIKILTKEERILEIAKMLSNGNPSEAAINNAKELLN